MHLFGLITCAFWAKYQVIQCNSLSAFLGTIFAAISLGVFVSAYGLSPSIHAFDDKPIQTSAKPFSSEPFDASTLLSIDPEPFGLELTAERLCRRVDELRASSRVEKLGDERLAEGSNGQF